MTQLFKKFGNIQGVLNIPHLLELQTQSYHQFLQMEASPAGRADIGLEGVFRSVFPIQDFNKTATLEFVSYDIGQPKFDVSECLAKGLNFEAPVRIKVRLVVYDVDDETGNRSIRDIKEQDIYFGTIPLMTEKGTFIINGTERVIVNQLQRSPGIIFEHDFGKTHSSRKVLYSSRIIPMRGSWLDFEFDHKDIFYVRIDRRRKMPVTILLKAMGMNTADIYNFFYQKEYYNLESEDSSIYSAPDKGKIDSLTGQIDHLKARIEYLVQEREKLGADSGRESFRQPDLSDATLEEIEKINVRLEAIEQEQEANRSAKKRLQSEISKLEELIQSLDAEETPAQRKKNKKEIDQRRAEVQTIQQSIAACDEGATNLKNEKRRLRNALKKSTPELMEPVLQSDAVKTVEEIDKVLTLEKAKLGELKARKDQLVSKFNRLDPEHDVFREGDSPSSSLRVFREIQEHLSRKEQLFADVIDTSGKVIAKSGDVINQGRWKRIVRAGITRLEIDPVQLVGQYVAEDIVFPDADDVLAHIGDQVTTGLLEQCQSFGITRLPVFYITGVEVSNTLIETMELDKLSEKHIKLVSDLRDDMKKNLWDVVEGAKLQHDILDDNSDEVAAKADTTLPRTFFEKLPLWKMPHLFKDDAVNHQLGAMTAEFKKELITDAAKTEIFKRLRPSSPPTQEVASTFFDNLFRNPDYYDLSPVGRYKLNTRLGLDAPQDLRILSNEDILKALKHLVELKDSHGPSDDIDHLGNRRVRPVGELVENQYRIGLVRMERAIKERMSLQDVATLMPHDLINPKPVVAAIKEFFGTSQLSQFMDQTNPLSEVTHKRRLSALGPGGLTRDRAGFEVRDVHTSHYGRICPIETPEGPNIGLIVSLTTFAQVNAFGFIESPYRIVTDGRASTDVIFLDASRESKEVIAQANAELDPEGRFMNEIVTARVKGDFALVNRDDVTLMDISPSQIVSVSASLIPFLEHDDANRALMGSNMQRQAVPLLRCEQPIVGTGMESRVAQDSGSCVLAEGDGIIRYVDAERIVVSYHGDQYPETGGMKVYELQKFHKSNQNTCFGQKPLVSEGQAVTRGFVLADGPGVKNGELALGKNLLVAFMPWCGFNFEDSILISERVVRDDVFTSIHIEEFEIVARDTKLGPEEVTRDIPNVGEEMLRNLDDSGIIRIGARVQPDDILVGKITPKGESQLTPEEKLLRAIFGDKARDVKNSSLKVPPGIEGTIIDVRVFNRRMGDKDERSKTIEQYKLARLEAKEKQIVSGLNDAMRDKIWTVVKGKRLAQTIKGKRKNEVLAEANMLLRREAIDKIPVKKFANLFVDKKVNDQVHDLIEDYNQQVSFVRTAYKVKGDRITDGDDLPPGVIKMVKVYVAVKRKLSVGDKMAGRHGNKGVVSCILPEEDMPFFADGTPVDIVLNPLGVPSRMNIGQIMETHLGWGALELGKQLAALLDQGVDLAVLRKEVKEVFDSPNISALVDNMDDDHLVKAVRDVRKGIITKSPVFDGAHEDEIWKWLSKAGLPDDGKCTLFDGRTGVEFHNKVTVGTMYMLKLHHLVDEKIHARSTGPYSLVTQQPLGGKAQFGGQRLGEMEVWAMEAYGAAHVLQEFLTVKSDDVTGRVNMYEKIVKGDNFLEAGLPESFNVLIKELMSLGLDVTLLQEERKRRRGSY